ncbi:Putative NmrA-like domain, NAD(P)-binding domain superfamily [Colletotrichum destructivum]|uniref:NmrA-like domain, NAD(P)-binding domain superfamily n=1 Tax=Colletotrichum destructivum TaxID=34406 RepID=A0AAX4HVP6_9PEZI|nr:Putative NmrA-like domain, NAD(P)-binding domain superfamily [Colletotrichum destructivum]
MAPNIVKYAKDQPVGFVNRIEKVAIVGVSKDAGLISQPILLFLTIFQAAGTMGKFVTQELLKRGKHTVTAITRHNSESKLPEGVVTAKVDYDDEFSIVEALKGQQYLVITLKNTAGEDAQLKLIRAAAKAGVPYVMPNVWGPDPKNETLMSDTLLGTSFQGAVKEIEQLGMSEWIIMSCGYWYEFSLAGSPDRYGFDIKNRSITILDDGNVKMNTSTWNQCGRGLAYFLDLKWLPEDENDTSPTIQKWANDVFYISSFLVSQHDMFNSVKRVSGTTDYDWKIENENSETRWRAGHESMKSGDRSGFSRMIYSRIFFPSADGDVENTHGLANEALGLPEEDLDKATEEAIRLCLSGVFDTY